MSSAKLTKNNVEDFKKSNQILKVESETLGETVYFVSNKRVAQMHRKELEGYVYYTGRELDILIDMSPENLKKIHLLKKKFKGKVFSKKEIEKAGLI